MHNPARFKKSRPNRNFFVYLSTPLVLELLEATFWSQRDTAPHVLKGGDVNVWIADSNGGNLRQLTTGNADQSATFSADGRFVYYQHWSEGTVHLYRVPFSGGPPVQVSDLQMKDPSVLHGGDRILVRYDDGKSSQWMVGIISAADGRLLQTPDNDETTCANDHKECVEAWAR